ncbi:protein-L-isoaspartate O-methyltransferase [Loktanella sp. F6476L]|uniref:protein-L-isoaspartate O-methyltransferase family protein n=1 Tax=Loktanella sp. F6476L TaxID=2926405 RepID=UPI001FF6DB30|nr:protein-L-isoaspartate O-methyltransferase [Loktanella sp. F6476L]
MVDYSNRRTMMVDTQVRPSDVTKFPIIDAMLSVPREVYVPDQLREAAYMGEHVVLSADRVVLEPRTFAKMLEVVDVQPDHTVLDLGCGLGYSTAVLARLADFVAGVEDDEDLANEAQSILSENGVDNAAVMAGDLTEGAAKSGPYDIIIAQGAVEEIPATILDQLRDGGRIAAIFAEGSLGVVRVGYKSNGIVSWRFSFNATAPTLSGFKKAAAFSL